MQFSVPIVFELDLPQWTSLVQKESCANHGIHIDCCPHCIIAELTPSRMGNTCQQMEMRPIPFLELIHELNPDCSLHVDVEERSRSELLQHLSSLFSIHATGKPRKCFRRVFVHVCTIMSSHLFNFFPFFVASESDKKGATAAFRDNCSSVLHCFSTMGW